MGRIKIIDMNEFEVYMTYQQVLMDLNEVDAQLFYYPENTELKQKFSSLNAQKDILERQLVGETDHSTSMDVHRRMIQQLNQFIIELDSVDPQLRVDRNQGLIINDFVFSKVYQYLDAQIKFPVGGIFLYLLYYSNDPSKSISKAEFKKFIQSEVDLLYSIDKINYVELMKYLNSYFERVKRSGLLSTTTV